MTKKQLDRLPHGTLVHWTCQGKMALGFIIKAFGEKAILWNDHEITSGSDEAALEYVAIGPQPSEPEPDLERDRRLR